MNCSKEQCVSILIEDDNRAENEEQIIVRLEIPGSLSNGIIPSEREKVITIVDDDGTFLPSYSYESELCW